MSVCVQESSESGAAAARAELQQLRARSELQLETLQESLSSLRSELQQQTAVNAELQKRLDEILGEKLGMALRRKRARDCSGT